MIEKLKRYIKVGGENTVKISCPPEPQNIMDKINELVDAVNELQLTVSKMENLEHLKKIGQGFKNLNDPYAEQRKWIGKLCRFWDDDNTNSSCGILTSIDTETFKEPQFVCNDEYDYEHCEPVKPDDDIIFKGE